MVIKTVCYWQKVRHINQRSILESPEISPRVYCQMIFERVPDHSLGKAQYFQEPVLGKQDIHIQKNEVGF